MAGLGLRNFQADYHPIERGFSLYRYVFQLRFPVLIRRLLKVLQLVQFSQTAGL